jgi:hypothetical protein
VFWTDIIHLVNRYRQFQCTHLRNMALYRKDCHCNINYCESFESENITLIIISSKTICSITYSKKVLHIHSKCRVHRLLHWLSYTHRLKCLELVYRTSQKLQTFQKTIFWQAAQLSGLGLHRIQLLAVKEYCKITSQSVQKFVISPT